MPDFSKILESCNPSKNAGKALLVLNAAGMIFAAISNTCAAAVDKNTSKEDKKFLVPAGAVTGVANIGIYYLMTSKIIKFLQRAAEKIEIKDENVLKFIKKKIDKKSKGLFKKDDKYIQSMKDTFFEGGKLTDAAIFEGKNLTDAARLDYKNSLKAGTGVLGAFIGAVVGCAVLTPIIRDVSAYFVQKHREKENPSLEEKPYMPYFDPSHLKPGQLIRANKKPLTMKNYMAFTNSNNLKV